LWSLVDLSSLAGLVVYAAFALKRCKAGPFLLALTCWCVLPLATELVWRRLGLAVEPNTELTHVLAAFELHASRFAADPLGYLGFLTVECGNLLFDENPLSVAICVVALGLISHKSKGLLRVCFLAPILVQLVLLPTTRDRGAAIAGNTIVIFALVSNFGVEAARRMQARFGAEVFALPLVGLVMVQVAWGYSGLYRWDYPANAFATGALREAGTIQPTIFAELSGPPREMPTVLGGPIRGPQFCGLLKEEGRPALFPTDRVAPYHENWSGRSALRRLLTAQAPILAALLIATLCLMRIWRGVVTGVLFACCVAGALLCGSTTGFSPTALASFESKITLKEDDKLVGAVQLSPEFVARLQEAVDRGDQLELFLRRRGVNAASEHPAEFQVAEWSAADSRLPVPAEAFLQAVRARGGRVEFSLTTASSSKGLLLHSWQKTRPNGERTARLVHADGSQENLDRFPSFEIRVVRGQSEYAFQKLIERFEPARAVSYTVVGF
ncbi:MAG TPA: hypothetical protein VFG04_20035, partial [Planctomycetaceae bacterium]|nr:hypothetical protein [Planctomycetaceae bacterium]